MTLKKYQDRTLAVVKAYFERLQFKSAVEAYDEVTQEGDIRLRLGKEYGYKSPKGLEDAPAVCIKVPTGGGKTILAAHSLKLIAESESKEYPLVIWFAPSDTIRRQTADALKNHDHPYRKELDAEFGGQVRVFDLDEKFQILPEDIAGNLCIVVSTTQAFVKTATENYNVYRHNEHLEPHFASIGLEPGMEAQEENPAAPKFSFANLVAHHHPIVVVDEAHHMVTDLSQKALSRLMPAAILGLTATPGGDNNVLYSVYAQELFDEQMVKLPIELTEFKGDWEKAVAAAIAKRTALAEKAAAENASKDADKGGYLNPIVLFQATAKNGEVPVEKLKAHLIDVLKIPEGEIRVATGEQKELDDVDVTDPTCKVNYVITVQTLKEGWDCPFAYVFCSLANVGSSKDTIQLLGRVMRMPYAKRRKTRELNRAYAFVMSDEFGKAAASLTDGLKKKGFDEVEAFKAVEEQLPLQNDLGELFNTPPDVVRLSSDVVNVLDGMMKDCQMLLQVERRHWLASVVADLHRNHGISCEQLVLIRYQLRSRLEWHYLEAIGKAKREAYLQVFALDTPHKLTFDLPGGFVFDEHIYEGNTKVYRGAWRFNKHFLGTYAIPQFDGKKEFGEGEEFECAKHIDANPKVVSWLRNKDSDPQSFKLPMGGRTDWFYPDFIGELDDGRLFVLEYKGKLTGQSEDTVEKDAIGKLWAAQDPKKYVYATIYGDAKSGLSPEQQVNSVLT